MRSDKGRGRIYDTPLTKKERDIRYVRKYLATHPELPHGKVWCYTKLGCRCDKCLVAVREMQRKYREKRAQAVS